MRSVVVWARETCGIATVAAAAAAPVPSTNRRRVVDFVFEFELISFIPPWWVEAKGQLNAGLLVKEPPAAASYSADIG
jgi:hypothetical protein